MLTVPVQIAATQRLGKYLNEVMPDVQIEYKWPDPSKSLPVKAITIIPAGRRNLLYMEYPQLVSAVALPGTNSKSYRWRIAECEQPLQLDVWAQFSDDRDDIVGRLDRYINVGFSQLSTNINVSTHRVSQNIVLELEGDWYGSNAYYTFDTVDYIDTPDQTMRQEYRASYRGMGFFNLSQDAISPTIAQINLKLKLGEDPNAVQPQQFSIAAIPEKDFVEVLEPVANLGALGALGPSTGLANGSAVFVITLRSLFRLDLYSLAPVDGITVLAGSGGGRWLRITAPHPTWTLQHTWYVNPSNIGGSASDENDGKTSSTPLLTVAEFGRRMQEYDPSDSYTINLMSNVLSTDVFNPGGTVRQSQIGGGSSGSSQGLLVQFVGTETTLLTGSVVSTVAQSNDTPNLPANITCSTISDFTSYIGKLIRVTSGASAGAAAIIGDAPSANTARLGDWFGFGVGFSAPSPGDTFDIVDWSTWQAPIYQSPSKTVELDFVNLRIPDGTYIAPPAGGGSIFFVESALENLPDLIEVGGLYGFIHSAVVRPLPVSGPPDGWGIGGNVHLALGTTIINVLVVGHGAASVGQIFSCTLFGSAFLTSTDTNPGFRAFVSGFPGIGLGIVDWPASIPMGLELARESVMTIVGTLWGSGPTTFVDVSGGASLQIVNGEGFVTGTGTTADLHLEKQPNDLDGTAIPALTGGAAVSSAAALVRWSDFTSAPFNGNVMSYSTGAKIITVPASPV